MLNCLIMLTEAHNNSLERPGEDMLEADEEGLESQFRGQQVLQGFEHQFFSKRNYKIKIHIWNISRQTSFCPKHNL